MPARRWRFDGLGTAVVTTFGALAIVASGALGVLTRRASEAALSQRAAVVAGAGAVMVLAAVFVKFGDWSTSALADGISDARALPVFLEVASAGLLALGLLIVLVRAPRFRLHAGGALVGLGALVALHAAGVIVHIVKWEGADALGWGGVVGILGGLLLVGSGARVVLAGRPAEAPAAPGVPAT